MSVKKNKPTILVVDDDSLIRDTLKSILRGDDFDIAGEAANGEAALELCRQRHPDVVLLDINMPGMDGLEVLRAIKKRFPATKVVMISAEATMERVKEAVSSGATGFIVKPFNAGRVLDDIIAVLNTKR
jgi:YesN/AraC family two-component response regulator